MNAQSMRKGAVIVGTATAWLLIAGAGAISRADDSGDAPRQGPARETSPQPVTAIEAPPASALPTTSESQTPAELFYRELPPVGSTDKTSIFTDMGFGLPAASPTLSEGTKLEMARAAVEAARAAGTLYIVPTGATRTEPSQEAEQAKLNLLHTTPPASLRADPAAGVGVEIPPIQLVGPPELTPAELEKLEGRGVRGDQQ